MEKNDVIEKYIYLVLEENEKINLTAITDIDEFRVKHIEDSLKPTLVFDFNDKVIMDLGSGAGFPGIPLAINFPSSKFVLVEPITKRANFLKKVKEELDLKNVEILNSRIEDLDKDYKYDVIVSRAVKELRILLELSIPYLKVGGTLIAYKGPKVEEEIEESTNALNLLNAQIYQKQELNLDKKFSRVNLFIRKLSETDKKYPRNFAQISKKPL